MKPAPGCNAAPGAAPVDRFIWEHREAVDFAVRAFMLGALAFAIWSIQRDVRAAWPRIVELFKERNDHDL